MVAFDDAVEALGPSVRAPGQRGRRASQYLTASRSSLSTGGLPAVPPQAASPKYILRAVVIAGNQVMIK